MKRFRLSTLMLLVVIAALVAALMVQQVRSSRREAEAELRIAMLKAEAAQTQAMVNQVMRRELAARTRPEAMEGKQ